MTLIKTAVLVAVCSAVASASSVYYTESMTASGVLDTTTFTNKLVTIVLNGNTANIVNPNPGIYADPGTATVTVAGLGTDTFTDTMVAYVNQNTDVAGIDDTAVTLIVLANHNLGFATFAMIPPIGPLPGASVGNSGTSFATAGGSFEITSGFGSDQQASFTATAPEPGTLGMLGAGIGLLLIRRRAAR